MFDYHNYYKKILLISGVGFIIYGLIHPTGDSVLGARIIVGMINLLAFALSPKLKREWIACLLIGELYLGTPYLFYISYISEHDPLLMLFSIIVFFAGSFLFIRTKANLIYILFNGLNMFMYMLVSGFSVESLIVAFLYLVMYFFVFSIHRSFRNSLDNLKQKELDVEHSFYWMARAVNSPLARISGLIHLFELGDNLDTAKIQTEIQSIKQQLSELEDRLIK